MDISDILYGILRTLIIGFFALLLAHQGRRMKLSIFSLNGRLNRTQFAIGAVTIYLILSYLYSFTQSLIINTVILEVQYWAVKTLMFLGLIIATPLLITLYARRLHDFNIPTTPAVIGTLFIIFTYTYNPLKSTGLIWDAVILIVNILLFAIPSNADSNKYGEPETWPTKRNKRAERRAERRSNSPQVGKNHTQRNNSSLRDELLPSKTHKKKEPLVETTIANDDKKEKNKTYENKTKPSKKFTSILTIGKTIIQAFKNAWQTLILTSCTIGHVITNTCNNMGLAIKTGWKKTITTIIQRTNRSSKIITLGAKRTSVGIKNSIQNASRLLNKWRIQIISALVSLGISFKNIGILLKHKLLETMKKLLSHLKNLKSTCNEAFKNLKYSLTTPRKKSTTQKISNKEKNNSRNSKKSKTTVPTKTRSKENNTKHKLKKAPSLTQVKPQRESKASSLEIKTIKTKKRDGSIITEKIIELPIIGDGHKFSFDQEALSQVVATVSHNKRDLHVPKKIQKQSLNSIKTKKIKRRK